MAMYPRLKTPGPLLAAVSGCGGDFEDLHNLSLLALGSLVTPAINIWFSPLVWFGIISVSCDGYMFAEAEFCLL